MNIEDKEILKLYREEGKQEFAFNLLVQKYSERLYWHIRKLTCSHEDSNDILQGALIKIWEHLPAFREESKLYTWIYRIATNETLTFLKKKRIAAMFSLSSYDSTLASKLQSDPSFNGDKLQMALHKAILHLPDKQRAVLKWQLELLLSDTLEQFDGDTVLVSHDRGEVRRLSDSVCVLEQGRSQTKVAVEELFAAPKTIAAALISGCKNIAHSTVTADGILCPAWGVTLHGAQRSAGDNAVGIRAHHLHIAESGEENAIPCTVERIIEDVFSTVVMLRTAGGGTLRMEVETGDFTVGEALAVAVKPEHVLSLRKEEA